jgi:hypothetical protein
MQSHPPHILKKNVNYSVYFQLSSQDFECNENQCLHGVITSTKDVLVEVFDTKLWIPANCHSNVFFTKICSAGDFQFIGKLLNI